MAGLAIRLRSSGRRPGLRAALLPLKASSPAAGRHGVDAIPPVSSSRGKAVNRESTRMDAKFVRRRGSSPALPFDSAPVVGDPERADGDANP